MSYYLKAVNWDRVALVAMWLTVVAAILVWATAELHFGCSAGPKPAAWTNAQYASYAKSACAGTP
jgi:hypothetical protein